MDLLGELQRGFAGSYRIDRELGGGGMSRVFAATEMALGRRVVIKVLAPELMLGVSADRFKREIAVVARLQHPHIVPVLSAGEAAERDSPWRIPYYTMPYVEGESLRARIDGGRLSVAQTLTILRDVARALQYAHERGVVHRDIKPDNVLLTSNSAVVTDFGVAKALDAARSDPGDRTLTHGGAVGTPAYMAPEQASANRNVDHRADIYSFGVMAYEMLAGARPGERQLPADVPTLLEQLVQRCLEHDPRARPQSAEKLVAVLDSISSAGGVAHTIGAFLDGGRRSPRQRRVAMAVFVGIVALVAAFLAIRARPGSAALLHNERLLVGDFRVSGHDSTLGVVVTEALRTALDQSRSIIVVPMTSVRDGLRRMARDAKTPVEGAVARELATREGIKAYVDGDVLAVGGRYAISARLVETTTGTVLASLDYDAPTERDILPAVDRLARDVRQRAGDSFRQIRDAQPLDEVTTASLDALRAYVLGVRALSIDGDWERGKLLLEEAVSIDTTFAMAYRKLGIELNNRGIDPVRRVDYLARAYRHRDRLTESERYLVIGTYFSFGPEPDNDRAIAAYEMLIQLQPSNANALNNVAAVLGHAHRYARANEYSRRAVSVADPIAVSFNVFGQIGTYLGDRAQLAWAIDQIARRFGNNPLLTVARAQLLYSAGRADSALIIATRVGDSGADAVSRSGAMRVEGAILGARGQVRAAHAAFAKAATLRAQTGSTPALLSALDSAMIQAWVMGDTMRARTILDRGLAAHPVVAEHHARRPYVSLVLVLTTVGEIREATQIAALFERDEHLLRRWESERTRYSMAGDIALAERRFDDAVHAYRMASEAVGRGNVFFLPHEGRAYDLGGQKDSAIAVFTRFVEQGDPNRLGDIWDNACSPELMWLAYVYRRLGELWEEKGDGVRAAEYYRRFVDLWENADPELQPQVNAVRRKLASLQ